MIVTLENVRSFSGKHTFPIKPLTILVGENSSGKTTFLAMLSTLLVSPGFPLHPTFNDKPYDLGSYDTIATNIGGRYGRASHFSIGYTQESRNYAVNATYERRAGQAVLSAFSLTLGPSQLNLSIDGHVVRWKFHFQPKGQTETVARVFEQDLAAIERGAAFGRAGIVMACLPGLSGAQSGPDQPAVDALFDLAAILSAQSALSVAPVRTKPKRTYDQMRVDFEPEGDHIPLVLDHVLGPTSTETERDTLRRALEKFGTSSGLFNRVTIKKLGKNASDPFQILIAVDRKAFNMADVGYGVSQSLPVIVQSVLGTDSKLLLLQQPEIHLHPRAQAALGSFFSEVVASGAKQFVVETHSDFLLDRVRQEVARDTLGAEAVGILFFMRRQGRSRVYPLTLDSRGNVLGAPKGYRDFFPKEQNALLTRGLI